MTTQTPKPEAQRTVVTGYLFSVGVQGNKTTFSVKQHEKRQYPDWYVGYFQNPNGNPAPQLHPHARRTAAPLRQHVANVDVQGLVVALDQIREKKS